MYLDPKLRARISALGELSRPLGEARATALARELIRDVSAAVSSGLSPEKTIEMWIRRLADEIVTRTPSRSEAPKTAGTRRLADLLPEVG